MIYELQNQLLIPNILELAKQVPHTDPQTLRDMLLLHIDRKYAKILVDERDGKVHAFIFASVEEFEGQDAVFIQYCASDPQLSDKDCVPELLSRINTWGKSLNIKSMYFMTRRHPRSFQRKYKFRFHTTVLKREIA